MPDNIFNTWKEIAKYLDRTVRTCQRWEKELKLPISRLDNYPNSRVFAHKDDLDLWKKKLTKKKNDQKEYLKLNRTKKITFFLFSLFIMIASIIIIYPLKKNTSNPEDFRIDGSKLIILDEKKEKILTYDTMIDVLEEEQHYKNHFQKERLENGDHRLPLIAFKDLDHNGSKEILFIVDPLYKVYKREMICLTKKGKEVWGINLAELNEECRDLYTCKGFGFEDLNKDGKDEIIILDSPYLNFPSLVLIVDFKGNVLGRLIYPGRLSDFECFDIDQDGIEEIILGGYNFEWKSQCCTVLDYYGGSKDFSNEGMGVDKSLNSLWKLKYHIIFPKNILNEISSYNNDIEYVDMKNEYSEKMFRFNSSIKFYLNTRFELEKITFSPRYIQELDKYKREGQVIQSLDEIKKCMLEEGLSYFTGNGWSKIPTAIN